MFDLEKLIKSQIEIDQISDSLEDEIVNLNLNQKIDFIINQIIYLERSTKSIFQHRNSINFLLNKVNKLKDHLKIKKYFPRNALPPRRLKRKPVWHRVGGRLKRL